MNLSYVNAFEAERGGFCFSNHTRNELLAEKLANVPIFKARKTGTTICGVVAKDAVVLAADTRATEGPIVADKNCQKLHRLADNIYCAGAGTAADLDHTTEQVSCNVELFRMTTGRQPRVSTVVTMLSQHLFKYQGHVSCALVLGGVDFQGPHLYQIYPHGSTDRLPFAAMGSGSLNAMAMLESGYRDNLSVEEAKTLVIEAISAGIFNDLGSGSNVDVVVIERDGRESKVTLHRNIEKPNPRLYWPPQPVTFPKGTTPFLKEKVENLRSLVTVEDVVMTE